MTDDTENLRTHETIKIAISKCRRLRGHKGEALTSFAHVEFDGKSFGDSSKVESSNEAEAVYNFSTGFDVSFVDGNYSLDDISYKPVLVTFTEVLPKEKKQKDEKTAILGQCTIDLLPLLHGETKFSQSLIVHAVAGSPLETLPPDIKKAEVDVTVSVNEPVLNSYMLNASNLLTVRLGSAYSLPETWSLIGAQHNYTVGLPIPINAEKEIPLIFSHGAMKPSAEKEQTARNMKWFNVPNVNSAAHFINNGACVRIPFENEKGDFKDKESQEFREDAEIEKNRVTWNIERRCYLEPAASATFQNKIAKTRLWPVELMRVPPPSQGKAAAGSKKDKNSGNDDENQISYHGVAYVDLAPLLYPGLTTVAGVFQIHPFSDNELDKKTLRKHAIAADVIRINSSVSRATGSSPVQRGKFQRDTVSKKGSALLRATDSGSEVGSTTGHMYVEAKAYEEARTFIYLEFSLRQPLVPRREPEQLARLVSEYIPPRGPYKKLSGGAAKAVGDYHSQISSISTMVLDEFRDMFAEELLNPSAGEAPERQDQRRRALLYKLNSSGKYFAFKEQIKHAVVKIVREKYMKTTAFTNKDDLQQFLSELYVYLVDEMHVALDKVLSVETSTADLPEPVADSPQLLRFAKEAEMNEDFDIADNYYQERLTQNKNDPKHWIDYGIFNLSVLNNAKARECFREAIALQQDHVEGLVMYGVLCYMEEDYDEAEAVFERATTLNSSLPAGLSWTVLSMFYTSIDNSIRAEHSLTEAKKLSDKVSFKHTTEQEEEHKNDEIHHESSSGLLPPSAGTQKGSSRSPSTKGSRKKDHRTRSSAENSTSSREHIHEHEHEVEEKRKTVFLEAAEWMLSKNALKFAEIALGNELIDPLGGPSANYFVALARLQMKRKDYTGTEESLKQATTYDHTHPDAWALTGHYHFTIRNFPTARDCFERTLAFVRKASEMHSIYLRLGYLYLEDEQYEKAKRTYLLACKHSPSCVSWLGVGQACYRLNELSEAEDALAEANILNNTNAEVWAYLSLVCLQTNRILEAEQSYKYALKLHLKDELLMKEINSLQEEIGFGNPSF